ncbi:MAG: helix-turn-helix domain-containing protein [Dorea sp.]|nr:helix-turn-helix domain-containing protein [Dorea sp.]
MQTELLIRFGKTVRKLRTQQNISQEAFADLCDLHRTYISDIELGKRNVSLENIEKIACALGTTVSQLFLEAENESI